MTIQETIENVRAWAWPVVHSHGLALCDEVERLNKALTQLATHHNQCILNQVERENVLRAELAELRGWKKRMLEVKQWWSEVEDCIRNRSDAIIGHSVAGTALRLINERDELQLRLFKALNPIVYSGRGNNSQGEG